MVVEVGLVAALLDDQVPKGELDALVKAIRLLPGLREISDDDVNGLIARAGDRTRRGDPWLCEVRYGLTHPALRRVAFRLAALFCAWDGVIDDKEQGYLNWLARTFEFSDEETTRLFMEATGQVGTVSRQVSGAPASPGTEPD
jgi:tellurite resistance protein